jgi:tetratricopeptide (TPR) repeat protein
MRGHVIDDEGSAMLSISLFTLFLMASISCFGAESDAPLCHVQVNMSAGSLPQNLKMQVFAADKRLAELTVPYTGSLVLPPLAPGEYRLQTGEGTNFITSGPLHVPKSGECEVSINILGHTDARSKLIEDDLDVEDLRVPRKARDRFEKGFGALQRGDLQEARKEFLEVVRLDPKLSRAYNVLGVISDQQQDRVAARGYFEKALELNPRSKSALMNLAKLCMLEKQYDAALALFERFRMGARDSADIHAMEADAYVKLGRYPEAIREAHAAHNLSHANWEMVHLIAATAYEALHQTQMAAAEYRLYLEESSNPEMRAVASRRLRELGGVAEASSPTAPMNSFLPR